MTGTSANYPEERPEDMDPSEPDGITSAPTPKPNQAPNSGPPGAVTKARLQSLEQNLLVLERNYGATHPQVGDFVYLRTLFLASSRHVVTPQELHKQSPWSADTCRKAVSLCWWDSRGGGAGREGGGAAMI